MTNPVTYPYPGYRDPFGRQPGGGCVDRLGHPTTCPDEPKYRPNPRTGADRFPYRPGPVGGGTPGIPGLPQPPIPIPGGGGGGGTGGGAGGGTPLGGVPVPGFQLPTFQAGASPGATGPLGFNQGLAAQAARFAQIRQALLQRLIGLHMG